MMPAVGSRYSSLPWWRHQMETFSASLAICVWNSSVTGELPAQRSVTRSYDAFFDLRLNKCLSKESWGWWFETPSRPVWRHCNTVYVLVCVQPLWSRHSADYEVRMIYQSAINIYNVTYVFADLTRLFDIAFRLESFPSVHYLNWNKKRIDSVNHSLILLTSFRLAPKVSLMLTKQLVKYGWKDHTNPFNTQDSNISDRIPQFGLYKTITVPGFNMTSKGGQLQC